jgi:hypothetical protein
MNVPFSAPRRNWPSLLLNLTVLVVVLAMAAATFVLSYSGVHAIVLQAGVSPRLARIYPGLFDAVFLIACVAAVVLRDARWWAQLYAWLVIILMVLVVGAADVVYAMNITVRHRTIEGVVAAAPWVLLLLGFTLMLIMFRQSRGQQAQATTSAEPAYLAPGLAELPEGAPEPETHALPVGVWLPEDEPEPYDDHGPEDLHVQEDVPAPHDVPHDEDVPQHEDVPADQTAQPAEPAAEASSHAPEPYTTDAPVAQEADAEPDARAAAADVDATGDAGPAEPLEEEPVMAAAADEAPLWKPEPPAEPEPAAESVAAANGEGVPAYAASREAAAPTTPYNYWDSGADSGYHKPDRVPTLPGEVIDDDAPPFATAPFAAVPRFNRVRSSPMPPEGDDEED